MFFVKKFDSFIEGLTELCRVSFSVQDALYFYHRRLPQTEEEAVTALALNAAFDRPTGNGVGWGEVEIKVDAFGVDYKTRSGLRFGWKALTGATDFDDFEGEYVFYIAHPKATEEMAAPADSTLRQSAEKYGWKEKSSFVLVLV